MTTPLERRIPGPILLVVWLSACVVIPTPEHGLRSGRGAISEADMAGLAIGKTTREEVLLRFGEPSSYFDDGGRFIYTWSAKAGYWFEGGSYQTAVVPGDDGVIVHKYRVTLEFDEQGVLTRKDRVKHGFVTGQGLTALFLRGLIEGRPKSGRDMDSSVTHGERFSLRGPIQGRPQSGRDIDSSVAHGERFSLEDLKVADGQTAVIVYRPGSMTGVIDLQLDEQHFADLRPGGFAVAQVSPGSHAIHYYSHRKRWGWDTLPFVARPDQRVFMKMTLHRTLKSAWRDANVHLEIVPETQAVDEIVETRRSDTEGKPDSIAE